MALEYVGGASGSGDAADYTVSLTALSGGIGTAAQADDIVVVVTGFAQLSDLNPGPTTAGYTEVADLYANDNFDTNLSVAYKVMGATPDTSVTVTGSGSGTYGAATVVHVWRGVDTASPLDVSATTATGINGSEIDSPAITPVTAGAVVLTCGLTAGSDALRTAPTGYGHAVQAAGAASRPSLGVVASKAWTAGAEDPGAWTGGTTSAFNSWAAVTLALRPAAGSTPSGSLTATLGALAATAAGTLTLAASLAGTFGSLASSSTGTLALSGTASNTLAPLTVTAAGAGQTAIAGTLSATLATLTGDASGALALQGSAANTLQAATAEATGALAVAGSSASTLQAASVTSAGTLALTGTASPTFGAATAQGTATLAIAGTAAPALQPASVASAATLALRGEASPTLAAATTTATATLPIAGVTSGTFSPLTVTASSGALTLGTASLTFDALAVNTTGALALQGVASNTPAALTAVGTATLTLRGDASPTFAPATASVTGTLPLLASLNVTFGGLTLASTSADPGPVSPTFDYQPMADSATRMLKRFGAAATLQRQTSTTYDPATGVGGVTETLMPTTAVVVSYQQNYIDGSLIQQGDRRALCDPNVEPKQGDRFAWQGEEYTVIGVTPVAPAGIPLLFEAQIRGG